MPCHEREVLLSVPSASCFGVEEGEGTPPAVVGFEGGVTPQRRQEGGEGEGYHGSLDDSGGESPHRQAAQTGAPGRGRDGGGGGFSPGSGGLEADPRKHLKPFLTLDVDGKLSSQNTRSCSPSVLSSSSSPVSATHWARQSPATKSPPKAMKHVRRHISASYHGSFSLNSTSSPDWRNKNDTHDGSLGSQPTSPISSSPLRSVATPPTRSDWATTIQQLLPPPSPSVAYLRTEPQFGPSDRYEAVLKPSSPLMALQRASEGHGMPPVPSSPTSHPSDFGSLVGSKLRSSMSPSGSGDVSFDDSPFEPSSPARSNKPFGIVFGGDGYEDEDEEQGLGEGVEMPPIRRLWRQSSGFDESEDEFSVANIAKITTDFNSASMDELIDNLGFCELSEEDPASFNADDACREHILFSLENGAVAYPHSDEEQEDHEGNAGVEKSHRENLPPPAEVAIDWSIPASDRVMEARESLKSFDFDSLSFSADDLVHSALYIFQDLDLAARCNVDIESIQRLILTVQGYMFDNVYHNWHHAFDVLQGTYALATQMGLFERLTHVETMALLVSALCHDLEHPGVNNPFLVAVRSELAIIYNDRSVLENHHCCRAFQLLYHDSIQFFKDWKQGDVDRFREVCIGVIMATDMARHGEYINRLKLRANNQHFEDERDIEILKEMEIVIKIADIHNVGKPFDVAMKWAVRITEELFIQGDLETKAGVSVTPMCNREIQSRVGLQKGFVDHVVEPFHQLLSAAYPHMACAFPHIKANRRAWDLYNDCLSGATQTWTARSTPSWPRCASSP